MKKRYGLENIIGKKSKIRFPSHVSVPKNREPLYFTLPAYAAEAEPPLSTAITMKKGDPVEFVDQFNEESYEYEEGLPLNVIIYVSNASLLFEIKPPSVSSLFGIVFSLDERTNSKFKAFRENILLASFNFGLAHQDPSEDFFMSEIVSKVKSIYGALHTFMKKRKRKKRSRWYLRKLRSRKAIIGVSNYLVIKKIRHRKFKRYRKKAMRRIRGKQIKKEIKQFYKQFELNETLMEFEDQFWDDLIPELHEDLLEFVDLSFFLNVFLSNLPGLKLPLTVLETCNKFTQSIINLGTSTDSILDIFVNHYKYRLRYNIPHIIAFLDVVLPLDEYGEVIDEPVEEEDDDLLEVWDEELEDITNELFGDDNNVLSDDFII